MYCQIALLSPPYSTLTYTVPSYFPKNFWELGMRIAVPLGNGALRLGVLLELSDTAPSFLPTDLKIRSLIWPLERKSLLSLSYMEMIKQLALRQLVTDGRILGNVLPVAMRITKNVRLRQFRKDEKPCLFKLQDLGKMSDNERALLADDFLCEKIDVLAIGEDAALSERLLLACDPPWPVRPNAHKQKEILDFLMDKGSMTRRDCLQKLAHEKSLRDIKMLGENGENIQNQSKNTSEYTSALNTLIKHALISVKALDIIGDDDENATKEDFLPPPMPLFQLNEIQQKIYDDLHTHLTVNPKNGEKKFYASLLYGVTGSGKTALYLELAKYCMSQGKSVLLLAPEVAIALKLRQDAQARNIPVTLYHGYQSQRLREKLFRECAKYDENNEKKARLIVGTRSALFLPINNLGLIILDEEHDDSFKQDEGLPYHAKDIAWYRMQKAKGLFIMGSATPDIKSFFASQETQELSDSKKNETENTLQTPQKISSLPKIKHRKFYDRVEMRQRIGNAILPEIELVDIKDCKQTLAPQSIIALKDCIKRGDQSIIMLNRRGYAPILYCLDCASVARCPDCDISLAYHKKRERVTCHYCGYSKPFPSPCSACKSLHFLPLGEGTERLEEDINNLLTQEEKISTKILRLDRDSTRREGRMEEILNAFAKQEAQILVGTQMLSKGHHFPNVTLALIADADLGLNFPDYRAAERTFQLLTQASGRAGRGNKKGKVLIQTRDTKHYCWNFIKNGNYDDFYAHELTLREKHSYPPFVHLALVRASYPYAQNTQNPQSLWTDFVKNLKSQAQNYKIKVMGPSPAPMSFLKGRLRFQCLIKGENWNDIRTIYSRSMPKENILKKNDLRINLDIDPVNML